MTKQQMIELVGRYFKGVDDNDFELLVSTLRPDCVFSVETHGVRLQGLDRIEAMFERLWAGHAAVRHQDFVYVASPEDGRVAVRFQVVNTLRDGEMVHKSNCNFFEIRDGQFSRVAVYMTGQNTLNPD